MLWLGLFPDDGSEPSRGVRYCYSPNAGLFLFSGHFCIQRKWVANQLDAICASTNEYARRVTRSVRRNRTHVKLKG